MTPPLHVCLVALNALPAIFPEVSGPVGGMETRAWLFARELAQLPGFRVSLALHSHQTLPRTVESGVELFLSHEPLLALRREVAPRLELLKRSPWQCLQVRHLDLCWKMPLLAWAKFWPKPDPLAGLIAARADVYCVFGVNRVSAAAIRLAKERHVPVLLFLAAEIDLDETALGPDDSRDMYGESARTKRFVLQHSSAIICQSVEQQARLKSAFGRESTVIGNPVELARWHAVTSAEQADCRTRYGLPEKFVLWMGRAEHAPKRPQLCLEIARQLPEIPFVMILNPRDPVVEHEIHTQAGRNVRIIPRVSPADMPALMKSAQVLLNTSSFEGSPNAFLQAAASGVPVVSLSAGAELLAELEAGKDCAGELEQAVAMVRNYWEQPPTLAQQQITLARLRERHDSHRQAQALAAIIRQLLDDQQR
jgi:glycosyltransferase involved in cell wall biosynthesis